MSNKDYWPFQLQVLAMIYFPHLWVGVLAALSLAKAQYDFEDPSLKVIKPSHALDYEWFGSRVDISGNYMVIGAPGSDSSKRAGYAYVYMRDTKKNKWSKVAHLESRAGSTSDGFGSVVKIHEGNVVVGAYK